MPEETTIGREILLEELSPGVRVLALNRPERLNALTFDMFDRLREVIHELVDDRTIRALVLTGAGRGFCAGLDLDAAAQLAGMSEADMLAGQERWARAVTSLREVPFPVIAAVNGPAAGAGFSLALAADIRIASDAASLNAAFVRIGLSGGDCGSSWLLPRIVGLGVASELLLTGRIVEADEARRLGLVTHVVPGAQLMDAALELAQQIAANSPLGMRLTKQVLQTNVDAPSLSSAVELENRNQVLATRSPDMVEALLAFREKRPPRFSTSAS